MNSNTLPTVNERELKAQLQAEASYQSKQIYTNCKHARQGDDRRQRIICMELSRRYHDVQICPVWKHQRGKCLCEPPEPPQKG